MINGRRREVVFRQAISIFLDNPEACVHPENSTLTDLIYGWGNEAWSAREEFLSSCITNALASKGAILEVGSGLSTLLIAAVAKRRNQIHWVLEHKPNWAKHVQSYLNQYDLQSIMTTCALKDYVTFCWYDAPLTQLPKHFSLIVCDGPPSRTKGGRYGLVPVMRKHIAPGCVILLDDGYRREERDIAERWCQELGGNFRIEGVDKPYIVMKVT